MGAPVLSEITFPKIARKCNESIENIYPKNVKIAAISHVYGPMPRSPCISKRSSVGRDSVASFYCLMSNFLTTGLFVSP